MAKFVLKAGAEVDMLTRDEIDEALDKALERAVDRTVGELADRSWMRRSVGPANVVTDDAGCIGGGPTGPGVMIYSVPQGYESFVHRLNVNAAGYSAADPLTTGELSFCRNANIIANVEYFLPVISNVAPVYMAEGSNSALWLNSGDNLLVSGFGLPPNTPFYFSLQVRTWRTGEGGR